MFTFPMNHFGGSSPPAYAVYKGTTSCGNSPNVTYTNAPIGEPSNSRWVVYIVKSSVNGGGYQPSNFTCTIGGITATRLHQRVSGFGSAAAFIAKVPNGTTATCVAYGNAGGLFYSVGAVYTVHNLLSEVPYDSNIVSGSYGSLQTTINVKKDGCVLAQAGGWTNASSTFAWSGTADLTEVMDANPDGAHDIRISGATKQVLADATGETVKALSSRAFYDTGDLITLSFR